MLNRGTLSSTAISLALWAAAVGGYVLLAVAFVDRKIDPNGGTGSAAADAFAYWLAGRHLATGEPLYGLTAGQHGAFLYPPIMAQLIAPFAALPLPVFVWLWRAVEFVALMTIVGSIRNAGIALLVFPALIAELEAANVNLLVAGALAAMIRGNGRGLGPAILPKLSALAAVPAGLARDKTGTLVGLVLGLALIMGSIVIAADLWRAYLEFLPKVGNPGDQGYNVGRFVSTEVRLAAGAVFAVVAIRSPIYAPIAVTLASPVLWFNSLSTLVACIAAFPAVTGMRFADRATRAARPATESHVAIPD